MIGNRNKSSQFIRRSLNFMHIVNFISRYVYLLGLKTLNLFNMFAKMINKYISLFTNKCIEFGTYLAITFLLIFKKIVREVVCEVKAPFVKLHSSYNFVKKSYKSQSLKGFRAKKHFIIEKFKSGIKNNKDIINRFMNYVYPAVGLAVLLISINVVSSFEYGLNVSCLGKNIGYIEDEYVFLDASKQMNSRINYVKDQELINDAHEFTLVRLKNDSKVIDKDVVADELIKASNKMICKATGLYINDDFVGAVKDDKELKNIINSYLKPWKEQYENADVSFVDDVVIKKGYYLTNSLCEISKINKEINAEKEEMVNYTVKSGDTPLAIAADNNVPYEQLRALNPGIEEELKPGQKIVVAQAKPLLSVKVEKIETVEEEIPFKIEEQHDANIASTYHRSVQKGKNGIVQKQYKKTIIDGVETSNEEIAENVLSKPVPEIVVVGTKSINWQIYSGKRADYKGGLLYPVNGGRISCGWYGYKGHTGIDISAPSGASIKAATSGKVVFAGWKGSYGNCVLIDHGNGVFTRYAHNSRNLVTVGDSVNAGEKIAEVGRTGNATGNHCHFEVILNGVPVNPGNYIGK